jgi:hypothetical protein
MARPKSRQKKLTFQPTRVRQLVAFEVPAGIELDLGPPLTKSHFSWSASKEAVEVHEYDLPADVRGEAFSVLERARTRRRKG